jgi:hypothetical protein
MTFYLAGHGKRLSAVRYAARFQLNGERITQSLKPILEDGQVQFLERRTS